MAFRIYTLAKELKLDSKVLVDICTKAGIPGKGSALASLTDEEVTQLKAYMAKGAAKAAPAKTAVMEPPALRREDSAPTGRPPVLAGKPPVIGSRRSPLAAKLAEPPAPEPESPEPEPTPVETTSEVTATAVPEPTASAPAQMPPPVAPPRKVPMLNPTQPKSSTPRPPPGPRGTTIRVAPLPQSSKIVEPTKPVEPEAQKPDIKLPIDALRASRATGTPLSAHLKKHETKKKDEPGKGATGAPPAGRGRGGAATPPAPAATDARGDKGRGKVKGPTSELDLALGGREARQLSRRRLTGEPASKIISLGDDDSPRFRSRYKPKKHAANTAAPRKSHVVVTIPCTVRSFSEALGVRAPQVLAKLLGMGKMVNINAEIDLETVQLLAMEFNVEIELKQAVNFETQMLEAIENQPDSPEELIHRAPVVTFLGHVDHGKTSLLDRIIGTNVVAGESGGITQHIRAYRIEKDGRPIAFVDTPGHEAFTEMRARGANVTDIAVLVVAADDGVMPQTEEAISHAKAANVPIVVALNKTDLPGWDKNRILQQLATAGLLATEWGGDVEVVACSALKGLGIDDLLDTLLTIAELHDYKANPKRAAFGTCLEAELHEGRGVVVKVLVQNGTLKVGDIVVCGDAHGRVKAMYDTLNRQKTYESVGPATPVNLTGLDVAPGAGEHFYVLDDIGRARAIAEKREKLSRERSLGLGPVHVTLESLHERLGKDETQTLNLILRADVRGSIEAIQKEIGKLMHDEVQIKLLQATVGGITEADVHLADASDAIIIGFNVVPDEKSRLLADQRGVQIRRYDIIYQVTDDLRLALEGMLKPERREVDLGRALIQRTFTISRIGTIAGCRVLSGTIERGCRARVIRDQRVIGEYSLDSLKREKDDAREVREGFECGIKLSGFNDLKEGDILEAFKVEEFARTL